MRLVTWQIPLFAEVSAQHSKRRPLNSRNGFLGRKFQSIRLGTKTRDKLTNLPSKLGAFLDLWEGIP